MGLFSGKRKYYAFAGSTSLFEEQPQSLISNILGEVISPSGGMASAVQWTIQTDVHARAKDMFKYAEKGEDPAKEGGYIRGLPTSNLNLVTVARPAIEAALSNAVGAYDEIVATKTGKMDEEIALYSEIATNYTNAAFFNWGTPPTNTHWDETRLTVEIPVINPTTGAYYEATNPPDFSRHATLLDGTPLLDIYGPDDFAELSETLIYDGKYRVTFSYTDNLGATQEYNPEQLFDLTAYIDKDLVQVKYLVGGETFYWMYIIDSAVDPIFEAAIDLVAREGKFLPVAVMMHDKVWFDSVPGSELETTTNRLLKSMATSADEVKEGYEEGVANSTEDQVGDVWDFFVHFAAPINSNVRGTKEYFWYFFQEMQDWTTTTWEDYYDYLGSQNGNGYVKEQPVSEIEITEAGQNGYNVAYRWSFIHTKDFPGEYTPPGATKPLKAKEVDVGIHELDHVDPPASGSPFDVADWQYISDPQYQDAIDDMFGPSTIIGLEGDDAEVFGYHDIVIVTRQNPEDPDNPGVPQGYQRMLIMGLSMEYKINTAETSGSSDYRWRYVQPQLFGTIEETREFRIPLLWTALKEVPTLHREEVSADAFTATVFVVHSVHVSWYQTGFFKWVVIIIAIIILIYLWGNPGAMKAAIAVIGNALGGSAIAMAIASVVFTFAIGWIMTTAAMNIGGRLGQVFAVVAMVVMFASGGGFENAGTKWSSMMESPGWNSAVNFLNAVQPLYDMGFYVYSTRELEKLSREMEDFLKDARERQMELEDAYATMGDFPVGLDSTDLINIYRRQGTNEAPDGYLTRTLDTNPGIHTYAYLDNFVNAAIMLPMDASSGDAVSTLFQELANQRRANEF